MVFEVRLSHSTLKVLAYLLGEPLHPRSGAEISKATSTASGTLYPMLARLENASWLSSEWEQIDPRKEGRPRRRFYKLTALGQNEARKALREIGFGEAPAWQPSWR